MPLSKNQQYSSELGDGDFAVDHHARTGRPLRKRRKTEQDSFFVDSALAVSDPEEEVCDIGNAEVIPVPKSKVQRRRSPSPATSEEFDHNELPTPADRPINNEKHPERELSNQNTMQVIIKDLVINLPLDHHGPILLQVANPTDLHAGGIKLQPSTSQSLSGGAVQKRRSARRVKTAARTNQRLQRKPTGFLDLPAELRNVVYRKVFVDRNPFQFDQPGNFPHGAAFLRTCRQVRDEGTSILYGENEFILRRRTARYGSYWESQWSEVGFKAVRRFLKTIGPVNISQLRSVTLVFEDATPSLNPELRTVESRRFVNDRYLLSALRHLADHGQLEDIHLCFRGKQVPVVKNLFRQRALTRAPPSSGRRRVESSDSTFLDHLLEIQADRVDFQHHRHCFCFGASKLGKTIERACKEAMVRQTKLHAVN